MAFSTVRLIKDLVAQFGGREEGSVAITDKAVLAKYINDSDFPFFVSFPRTGSHWLRLMMELYFERPSLVRVFYFPERTDYMTLHTHDMDLDVYRKNILYLYRDPVPTVYSQMGYEKEDPADADRVRYWADRYAAHLNKWLLAEDVSETKTVLRYERLRDDLAGEFAKVTAHFGQPLDAERLVRAAARSSKEEVSRKTTHDPRVVNLKAEYADGRKAFAARYADLIAECVVGAHPGLERWLGPVA